MRPTLLSALLLPVLLALSWGLSVVLYAPPEPLDAGADPGRFSASRAHQHLMRFATQPHPMGSPANDQVRAYLVAELQTLGWQVDTPARMSLQSVFFAPGTVFAGWPTNIVAQRPGTGEDPGTLVLMAHYDARWPAPGASDDGAGVATLLEIARALGERAFRNNLVILLTDGEEGGLFGAKAFFDQNPLAEQVDLVLNFEARGSRGPVFMFETSRGNGQLIALFAETARPKVANSLTGAVYRAMPNGTDLTAALDKGIAGLNFAWIDGLFDYHSATDTPETISLASLQAMGQQGLALVRRLAEADLPVPRTADAAYFDLFGWFIHYPAWAGWLVLVPALALLGVGLGRAARRQDRAGKALVGAGTVARGLAAHLLALILFAALVQTLSSGMQAWRGGRLLIAYGDLLCLAEILLLGAAYAWLSTALADGRARRAVIGLAAVAVLASLAVLGWQVALAALLAGAGLAALAGRPVSVPAFWGSGLALVALLALLAQIYVPAAAYLLQWPLLLAALMFAWQPQPQTLGQGGVVALASLPATYWIMGLTGMLFLALGLMLAAIMVVPAFLLAALMTPLFAAFGRQSILAVFQGGIAVGLLVYLGLGAEHSARYPRSAELIYVVEPGMRSWARLSPPDAWAQAAVGAAFTRRDETDLAPFGRPLPLWVAPAPEIEVRATPPVLRRWQTDLVLEPGGPGRLMLLRLHFPSTPQTVQLDGQALKAADTMQLLLNAPPDTVTLSWQGAAPPAVDLWTAQQPWPEAIGAALKPVAGPPAVPSSQLLNHALVWRQSLGLR